MDGLGEAMVEKAMADLEKRINEETSIEKLRDLAVTFMYQIKIMLLEGPEAMIEETGPTNLGRNN